MRSRVLLVALGLFVAGLVALAIVIDARMTESTLGQFSDRALLEAVYGRHKYPGGFYEEMLGRSSIYYESDRSLTEPEATPICTDDPDEARAWFRGWRRKPRSMRETERYFEVVRPRPKTSWAIRYRISKCSYFSANQIPVLLDGHEIGTLNHEPRSAGTLRELAEYLWFAEHNDDGSMFVLRSALEDEASLRHVIWAVEAVYGDWGLHDRLTLQRHEFTMSKESGAVFYRVEDVRTIDGRYHPPPS